MTMHYRIDVTHLHISLQMSRVSLVDCQPDPSASSSACNVGWVSVGFATSPGLMTGATAVIGTPGGTDGIKLYELTASRAAVELPAASQTLEAAMMHADDEEFVMSFQIPRTDHAAAGRRLSVFVSPTAPTHLIFAHGHLNGASGLASHGYNSKASLTVALNHATFEPPMNPSPPPVPPPSLAPWEPGHVFPPPLPAEPPLTDGISSAQHAAGGAGARLGAGIGIGLLVLALCIGIALLYRRRRAKEALAAVDGSGAGAQTNTRKARPSLMRKSTYSRFDDEGQGGAHNGRRTCVGLEMSAMGGDAAPRPPPMPPPPPEDEDVRAIDAKAQDRI